MATEKPTESAFVRPRRHRTESEQTRVDIVYNTSLSETETSLNAGIPEEVWKMHTTDIRVLSLASSTE